MKFGTDEIVGNISIIMNSTQLEDLSYYKEYALLIKPICIFYRTFVEREVIDKDSLDPMLPAFRFEWYYTGENVEASTKIKIRMDGDSYDNTYLNKEFRRYSIIDDSDSPSFNTVH